MKYTRYVFDFERLDVYQKALEFTAAKATASSRGLDRVPARGDMPRAGGGEAKPRRSKVLLYGAKRSRPLTNRVFSLTLNFRKEIQYSLGDQFRRAALSICNNLAEGSRKIGKARKQYYDYALDSARECVPMITLCVKQGQMNGDEASSLRDECIQICNMLYKLSLSSRSSSLTLNT